MHNERKNSPKTTFPLQVPTFIPSSPERSSPAYHGYLSQIQVSSGQPPFIKRLMAPHFLGDEARTPYSGTQTTS